jgi:hypothetical protein
MRQQFINDFASQLLMVGARTFNQGDGFREKPAVLFPYTLYVYLNVVRIHALIL